MAEEERKELHNIRLHVYDTDLPVYGVPVEEEPFYRDAAMLITDTMNSYASYYKGSKNNRDLLYMALIDIALKYEIAVQRNDTAPYRDILTKLTKEIEEAIDG